ncbi:MAG TPA: carbohydrate porin [Kofleriaceae bacterium]
MYRRASLALVAILSSTAVADPDPQDDAPPTAMGLLAAHGKHDLDNENWNAYAQMTYISLWKRPFDALYTDKDGAVNSLRPDAERSFTATFTVFLGLRLYKHLELYVVPEVVSERALTNLHGLGGSIPNFELQKSGSTTPKLYRSRLYLRDTIDLGGERVYKDSSQQQLGGSVDSRRLVFTLGNFTVLDVLDKSAVIGDMRSSIMNMAFMTHASYDFAADARGYSWGGVAELYWDDWAVRVARMQPPKDPNGLPNDFHFWRYYNDSVEIEHDHTIGNQHGSIKLLGYRNHELVGRFSDAIDELGNDHTAANCPAGSVTYGSTNAGAPDLCWVRKPQLKHGAGIAFEQFILPDVGVFARAMYSEGRTEVDAYNSADRDVSVGAIGKGTLWKRPYDTAGMGLAFSWISDIHAQYLDLGGIDAFVGDGDLTKGTEGAFEVFYSAHVWGPLWLGGDYQRIWNPGFNKDRGPLNVFGVRGHAEF